MAVWTGRAAIQAPEGFTVEKAVGEPQITFPMFAAFDERGRLFVAESSGLDLYAELVAQTRKCRVSVLEDKDGDGRYETARVFADKLVFPMGLVWREGKLYVADPPDLVAYDDADLDGVPEKRSVVLTGFGHTDNGSLHGLIFGPDGWLYMTMGNPDGYRLRRRDGTFLTGGSGALIRSRPDGTDPETLSRGFENLVEVVFLPGGDVIGTDNWFQRPLGGIRDALVHLVPGGLYPYNADSGTPQPVTGDFLPAVTKFPAIAVSGLDLYRGSVFPAEMRGNLFSAQHNSRKVGRHILHREGSTFRSDDSDFISSDDPDFHPSDVLEDADGSLLIVDTGGWYVQHCPTGRIRNSRSPGGIFRVRFTAAAGPADARGLRIEWTQLNGDELVKLLDDARPVVRDRAAEILAAKHAARAASLVASAVPLRFPEMRPAVLWALSRTTSVPGSVLESAFRHAEPDVVKAAARIAALSGDKAHAASLTQLLTTATPPVQLAAAEALARCGSTATVPVLWRALSTGMPDRFLEHALIYAAYYLADDSALKAALADPSPRVQRAALALQSQPPRNSVRLDDVLARLDASDAALREAAMKILSKHPEWSDAAARFFAEAFDRWAAMDRSEWPKFGALAASLRTHPDVQRTLADALEPKPDNNRVLLALDLISRASLKPLPGPLVDGLRKLLREPASPMRRDAVHVLARLQVAACDNELNAIVESADPDDARLDSLRALIGRKPELSPAAFSLVTNSLPEQAPAMSRLTATEILRQARLSEPQLNQLLQALGSMPGTSPSSIFPALMRTPDSAFPKVISFLKSAFDRGWRPGSGELDELKRRAPEPHRAAVNAFCEEALRAREQDLARLTKLEPLLSGGDEDRGRAVFYSTKTACGTCHRVGDQGGRDRT